MTITKKFATLYKLSSTGKVLEWTIASFTDSDGSGYITVHGQQDGKKQTDTVYVKGKNVGRKNETTADEQATSEAESIYNKKQDKGYAKIIQLTPPSELAFKPMLAHKWADYGKEAIFPGYVQPKLDGQRCLIYKEYGKVILKSRGNKLFTCLDHLAQQFSSMPDDIAFDGELYAHGTPFEKVCSWIKRLQADTKRVCFHAYDLINKDPYHKRYDELLRLLPQSDSIGVVQTKKVMSVDDLVQARDEYIAAGYEGGMFRQAHGLYKAGYKSHDLLKLKLFEDDEFEIIGSYDGVGRAEGEINFICKLPNGNTVKVPMNGEKETLKQMWLDRDKYLGKMLTVQYQGWTNAEPPDLPCLRFPKGKTVRLVNSKGEVLY
jgi:ATP-dependent DNA ligase